MPLMIVSVARSLVPKSGTTLRTGSVARSVAISPVVHAESDEGGQRGTEARPPLEGVGGEGMEVTEDALAAASGEEAEADATVDVWGRGTVCIFCVLKGSFIGQGKIS